MKKDKKHTKLWLMVIVGVIIVVPAAFFLMIRLEGEQPSMELDLVSSYIGRSQELSLSASDTKSGLRQLWVGLMKDGKEVVLYDESFPSAGFFKGGTAHDILVKIPVAPLDLGFNDWKAILRMVVRDYSWRNWWKGNQTYAEKPVVIDTRAPAMEVFTSAHNVNQGGAGLVIFRTSETCSKSGVQVGNKFFPGHAGYFKDPLVYLTFFALGYEQGRDTTIHLIAVDQAGNQGKSGLTHYIRRKTFKKDRINITDRFLKKKLPDFDSEMPRDSKTSPVARFLLINRDLRQANYQKIAEACRNTDNKLHWQGEFLRLPNSANRAGYA
ncbi:MAG: M23 family peptidase, partial [Deltaproteobacteria bacterium]|nr:M23 family peptidase [Deltaproteobacteria bacterium]